MRSRFANVKVHRCDRGLNLARTRAVRCWISADPARRTGAGPRGRPLRVAVTRDLSRLAAAVVTSPHPDRRRRRQDQGQELEQMLRTGCRRRRSPLRPRRVRCDHRAFAIISLLSYAIIRGGEIRVSFCANARVCTGCPPRTSLDIMGTEEDDRILFFLQNAPQGC